MSGTDRKTKSGTDLGSCPSCSAAIPGINLLIRYESEGGWPRLFAECPNCEAVVHPE